MERPRPHSPADGDSSLLPLQPSNRGSYPAGFGGYPVTGNKDDKDLVAKLWPDQKNVPKAISDGGSSLLPSFEMEQCEEIKWTELQKEFKGIEHMLLYDVILFIIQNIIL